MKKFLFLCVIFFLATDLVSGQEPNCTNFNNSTPEDCSQPDNFICQSYCDISYDNCDECEEGCICDAGYALDLNKNQCVNIENCTCTGNRVFTKNATTCPATCSSEGNNTCETTDGCACPDGYLLDKNNNCVTPDDCCEENEEFLENGSTDCEIACNYTCNSKSIRGCYCKDGYVRNNNGTCVSSDQCSCDITVDPTFCGFCCQATCAEPNKNCSANITNDNFSCPSGYLYDESTGRCELPDDCACSINEIKECRFTYDDTCTSYSNKSSGSENCTEACYCKTGYVRNSQSGHCVPVDQCCCENEVFSLIAPPVYMQESCDDLYFGTNKYYNVEITSGCVCADGYVRNVKNKCVLPEECECISC